ncbi:hypothetical protein CHH55_13105 [Niallia circulans]|jgi:hypothetical protein|uniref:Uncharacterized protein n=1 Tax=Niallia circulans TaxID=1397 RepID=A0A0J1ILG4_NIACI|nr:hypothetical protein [Niallia circulans]KLV26821.1 hypothetical protein ABW02_09775 [Niallia circulans]MCM2981499.1 hypothetical protein [Niallia circulans]MDR4318357.1 hypothetical protein [Niallia circulans]MED3841125.1 hypothetical protein [Niallia circulans]MED4246087.1 hypothetical protein [Niallia circulans]
MNFVLNSLFLVMIFCCFSFIFYQSFFAKTRKENAPILPTIKLENDSCKSKNTGAFSKDIKLSAE